MSDAGQEAARRWPQAVNSRDEFTYPTAALYEFRRGAFVAGAEWQAGQGAVSNASPGATERNRNDT